MLFLLLCLPLLSMGQGTDPSGGGPPPIGPPGSGGGSLQNGDPMLIFYPYLSGICEYGKNCEHRHPSDQECLEYRARFAGQICRNGEACTTYGCLYAHPARDMILQWKKYWLLKK